MKLHKLPILTSRTRKGCGIFWTPAMRSNSLGLPPGQAESEALFEQASAFVEEVK